MAIGLLGWTDGAGKNWETATRTRDSVAYENPVVLLGEPYGATYDVFFEDVATTNTADHLFTLGADGTLYTRIKRIYVEQTPSTPTATMMKLRLYRTSTT